MNDKKIEILDITIALMKEKPQHEIEIKDIVEKSNISKVTINKYFKQKNDIIFQAIVRYFNSDEIMNLIDNEEDCFNNDIRKFVEKLYDLCLDNSLLFEISFFNRKSYDFSLIQMGKLNVGIFHRRNDFFKYLTKLIKKGVDEGVLTRELTMQKDYMDILFAFFSLLSTMHIASESRLYFGIKSRKDIIDFFTNKFIILLRV